MTSLPGSRFPDPHDAPPDAPLAVGGDLRPSTLVDAYRHGIFPWPTDDGELWWWSPDPRALLPLDGPKVSRSLRRTLRSGRLRCTVDAAFGEVVAGCADRPGGTWILPAMRRAYRRLHDLGHAHSVEVWEGDALVGGLYGVTAGAAFTGESMFHRVSDASKVALVHLLTHLRERGFTVCDAQLPTPHLVSMGAHVVPRSEFLARLEVAVAQPDVRF